MKKCLPLNRLLWLKAGYSKNSYSRHNKCQKLYLLMLPVNARVGVLYFASLSTTIYIAAVKGLALMGATSHTLNLTWAPMDARVCMLENITVAAVRPGQNQEY